MDGGHYEEEIKSALLNGNLPLAAVNAKKYLDESNHVPVAIAITGESGSGKSTLVNALIGKKNKADGAAPTSAVETTMEPTEYLHPQNPNIKIWDLPGIGTTKFTADKYLEYVGFEKFDFFIIVSEKRFKENDAKLAKEIQKMKKKFYFVRSQIDNSINSEKNDDPNLNEKNLLNDIRNYCTKELQKLGIESPQVFLVSGQNLHLFEFKDLWKTLKEDLTELQRDALLLALPNISTDIIEQKKNVLRSKIKWWALYSALGAVVPVPFLSGLVDLEILVEFAEQCQKSLGLTLETLQKLSDVNHVPVDDLIAVLKSPLAVVEITTALVLRVLTMSAVYVAASAAEEGARFIPFFGIPVAVTLSSATTYGALNYILDTLAEDAQRVFTKALGLNRPV